MSVQLSHQDYADLKKKGFSDAEIKQAVNEIEREDLQGSYQETQTQRVNDPRTTASQSQFGSKLDGDIIRWQLELNDILERAEHILRGDVVEFRDGHMIWRPNPRPQDNALNDFGVKLIMKFLSNYINRNTILADYEAQEVNEKVHDFGKELSNLIFLKYEEMGMTDLSKRKEYPMLVRAMVDIVHSAYSRAKMGGERRSLREQLSVTQSHQLMAQGGMTINPQGQPQKVRGILNPMRYFGGKYA